MYEREGCSDNGLHFQVSGMESDEGEAYSFYEAVVSEGPAEEWMTSVDEAMKASLHGIAKEGVFMYGCKPRSAYEVEIVSAHEVEVGGPQRYAPFVCRFIHSSPSGSHLTAGHNGSLTSWAW